MHIFARLTKVDEAQRTVEGIIASEATDRSQERFDYARSKPHFIAWSDGIGKATSGKSLGNVRVMHGNTVAGVTKELNFNDEAKQITVKAHIVDDNEWKKTLAGCYTGFSIGGKYVGDKWDDPAQKGVKCYEAQPHEYSLVDLPCNPDAQFTVVKADGSQELRKFETSIDDVAALAKWVETLSDAERDALAKAAARKDNIDQDVLLKAETATMSNETNNSARGELADSTRATIQRLIAASQGDPEDAADGGADEATEKLAKAADDMAKVEAARDEALAKIAAITAERDELQSGMEQIKAELEKIAKQPAPAKGAARVVEKTLANGDPVPEVDDKPIMRSDGSVDHIATAHKLAKQAYSNRL